MSPEQDTAGGEFMLFGVRVVVDSMRKSVSLNNLSQYEHRLDSSSSNNDKDVVGGGVGGYASADETVPNSSSVAGVTSSANRERKRGTPWTEEEHKLFLMGLQKVGKGDWRGIAKNFVKSRTPTQVASHAQKYFLRRSNLNRRRRRSSVFDITTDTVATVTYPANEQPIVKENNGVISHSPSPPAVQTPGSTQTTSNVGFSLPETSRFTTTPIFPMRTNTREINYEIVKLVQPSPINSMVDFNLNENSLNEPSPLSLNLSLSISSSDLMNSASSASPRHSAGFQVMQGFRNGESMISVV